MRICRVWVDDVRETDNGDVICFDNALKGRGRFVIKDPREMRGTASPKPVLGHRT